MLVSSCVFLTADGQGKGRRRRWNGWRAGVVQKDQKSSDPTLPDNRTQHIVYKNINKTGTLHGFNSNRISLWVELRQLCGFDLINAMIWVQQSGNAAQTSPTTTSWLFRRSPKYCLTTRPLHEHPGKNGDIINTCLGRNTLGRPLRTRHEGLLEFEAWCKKWIYRRGWE